MERQIWPAGTSYYSVSLLSTRTHNRFKSLSHSLLGHSYTPNESADGESERGNGGVVVQESVEPYVQRKNKPLSFAYRMTCTKKQRVLSDYGAKFCMIKSSALISTHRTGHSKHDLTKASHAEPTPLLLLPSPPATLLALHTHT